MKQCIIAIKYDEIKSISERVAVNEPRCKFSTLLTTRKCYVGKTSKMTNGNAKKTKIIMTQVLSCYMN